MGTVLQMGTAKMRDCVGKMLDKDFRTRLSIKQVMEHELFATACQGMESAVVDDTIIEALKRRKESNEFLRAMMADFASKRNLADMKQLNALFIQLDKDNNGTLSVEELRTGLQQSAASWNDGDVEEIIKGLTGGNPTKEVHYEEFTGELMVASANEERQILQMVFDEHSNSEGVLGRDEVIKLLERPNVQMVLGARSVDDVM